MFVLLVGPGAGGCMKIYPDPELPDAKFEWSDCMGDDASTVAIAITGVDDPTEHHELTAACTDLEATIKDVARQRFNVSAELRDSMGTVTPAAEGGVLDLRNGFDETAYLYFGSFENFVVTWRFDMGATCASLGANEVNVSFSMNGQLSFGQGSTCSDGGLVGQGSPGVYSVTAAAIDFMTNETFAISQPIPDVTLGDGVTEIGPLILTPCAPNCPSP